MIPESPGFFLAAGPREKGYNISIMKLFERIRQHPVAAVILLYAIYTSLFFLIEQLNLPARWTIVCPLDDLIPFVPQAVIPYCLWHIELAVFLLAFLRYQPREEFLRAALTMWAGMMTALVFYLIVPNEIHLRPAAIDGSGFSVALTRLIWTLDNTKNVCPSIHVISALIMNEETVRVSRKPALKIGVTLLNAAIIVATMLLKQHSIIDVLAAFVWTAAVLAVRQVCFLSRNTGK